jgi:hypothetical protein
MICIHCAAGDATGRYSVFTRWRDAEIMFHVSTMITPAVTVFLLPIYPPPPTAGL